MVLRYIFSRSWKKNLIRQRSLLYLPGNVNIKLMIGSLGEKSIG